MAEDMATSRAKVYPGLKYREHCQLPGKGIRDRVRSLQARPELRSDDAPRIVKLECRGWSREWNA